MYISYLFFDEISNIFENASFAKLFGFSPLTNYVTMQNTYNWL